MASPVSNYTKSVARSQEEKGGRKRGRKTLIFFILFATTTGKKTSGGEGVIVRSRFPPLDRLGKGKGRKMIRSNRKFDIT